MRVNYINLLLKGIKNYNNNTQLNYRELNFVVQELEDNKVEPKDIDFMYYKEVWEYNVNWKYMDKEKVEEAQNYLIEASNEMYNYLFNKELYNYYYDTLPFIVTRYISKLEEKLYKTIVDNLIVDRYLEKLYLQLNELRNFLKLEKKYRKETLKELVNRIRKKVKKREIKEVGYPKSEIVYILKNKITEFNKISIRKKQIDCCREIFNILCNNDCKKMIEDNKNLKKILKKKLIEFRYKENLREAQKWWRNIFGYRIPIENEE